MSAGWIWPDAEATRRTLAAKIGGRRANRALWIAFCFSAGIILLQFILSVFPPERTESFNGPFAFEAPASNALLVRLNRQSGFRYLLVSTGDTSAHPYQSDARISINGIPLGPGHILHDSIRSGKAAPGSFSHWQDYVLFSLPYGVHNDTGVTLDVTYQLALHGIWTELAQFIALISAALLALGHWLRSPSSMASGADRAHMWLTRLTVASGAILMLAALAYLVSIITGWKAGWALPTTTVFSQMPWLRGLAEADPALPHAVLFYAMASAVLSWVALSDPKLTTGLREREANLERLFSRFGLPIILAWFVFSVAGAWAGIPRPQDLSGNAIAGLVPFNDAIGHFTQTFEQVVTGHWNSFGSRRPLAAALRGAVMFISGYSNMNFILLQTVALAFATFFATRAIMRWRGPWAGLTFLGLSMITVRIYLPTNLTEPLGILLALIGIPYLVRALATESSAAKTSGFLFTNLALTIRMGNMFAIPAMALWMFLTSAAGWRGRLRTIAAILGVVVLAFSMTTALSKAFGSAGGEVGSNFSYTFCGLTHNADWTACERIYANELSGVKGGEAAVARSLYKLGFAKLRSDPLLLATRLTTNMVGMVTAVPRILLNGYTGTIPAFFPKVPWLVVVVLGFIRVSRARAMSKNEVLFWVLFGGSMLASASVVFADDGVRVLCVSYPILFLLIATAFTTRSATDRPAESKPHISSAVAAVIVVCIAVTSLSLPWLAHKWDVTGSKALEAVPKAPGEDIYLASRYMSGFLVIADGEPLRQDVASIHYSDYRRIIENSHVEDYEKISAPPPPFGLVAAPGIVANGGWHLVVPEKVFTDREALGWKITYLGGSYFRRVDQAVPIRSGAASKP